MDIINIEDLRKFQSVAFSSSCFANDYIFLHSRSTKYRRFVPSVFRIEGMAIYLCTKGHAKIKINFKEVDINPGTLIIIDSHFLIELSSKRASGLESYLIFMSKEFVNAFHFDASAYSGMQAHAIDSPVIRLTHDQLTHIGHYFGMLSLNARTNLRQNPYTLNIAQGLISALIYQLLEYSSSSELHEEDLNAVETTENKSFRHITYATRFMRLVRENYRKERSTSFYARQLCITPKYLSTIVKDITGRGASDWIDNNVIVEAKNLLRHSGMDIQQIAFSLNFPTQSEFARFFKRKTGMSPTAFRDKN